MRQGTRHVAEACDSSLAQGAPMNWEGRVVKGSVCVKPKSGLTQSDEGASQLADRAKERNALSLTAGISALQA